MGWPILHAVIAMGALVRKKNNLGMQMTCISPVRCDPRARDALFVQVSHIRSDSRRALLIMRGLLAASRFGGCKSFPGGRVESIISVTNLTKTYASGFQALKNVSLEIRRGEIFALLGPNGAGKTTLISIICGIVNPTSGTVLADGHDILRDYRAARSRIGLVPQELASDAFESVWSTVKFSRGLFGKPPNPAHLEKVLRDLSLWDKKDSSILSLSGGMKRRVMIAKALAHEPQILFLDEPTAGVDVELRRDMWEMVRSLRESGVTIILTTHYIEEAEEMADRIGVINKGEIVLVENKQALMHKLGRKQLTLHLQQPLERVPPELANRGLELSANGVELIYTFDSQHEATGIASLLRQLNELGIDFKDLKTTESSLEEIFVNLVRRDAPSHRSAVAAGGRQ
jgi:ABC-2 type transport system ATP-binding protein